MIAVRTQFCVRMLCGFSVTSDQPSGSRSTVRPVCFFPVFQLSVRPFPPNRQRCGFRPIRISCNSSRGSSGGRSGCAGDDDGDQDYLPASLLLAETVAHYRMLQQGYQEVKWPVSHQFHPLSRHSKGPRIDSGLFKQAFLRRFPSPTIFLKITYDRDYVLPITVGEYSLESLLDAIQGDDNQNCPDQFQFVKNLPENFGYRMEMVRITKRVAKTYFARLYFSKPENDGLFSVDARPSDAINVAYRCQMPIYVNKQIVLTDAIRIGYGLGRTHDANTVYDVTLDSAPEVPDVLVEELDLVRNMNLAIKEERYIDAAMLRDKLRNLRKTKT